MRHALRFTAMITMLAACGADANSSAGAPPSEPDIPSCAPTTSPVTRIVDVIALINEQPKPLSLDCLVAKLYRPLELQATGSVISAQPAAGPERPRIFLHSEGLFLSLVPGDNTLEFGETWQSTYSIKGELIFPIKDTLSDNAPFVQIGPVFSGSSQQTRCGGPCHISTLEYSRQGGVTIFASRIIRPNPQLRVPIDELKAAWTSCASWDDPACRIYEALFGADDPLAFEFRDDLPFY